MKFGKCLGILFLFLIVASSLFATVSEKPRQGLVSIFEDLHPASEPQETLSNAGDQPSETATPRQTNQFTGRRLDGFTSQYFNRNRYYQPKTGRFSSSDPIGFGGGLNLYAYGNNNPLKFTDPTGKFGLLIPFGIWIGQEFTSVLNEVGISLTQSSDADVADALLQITKFINDVKNGPNKDDPKFCKVLTNLEQLQKELNNAGKTQKHHPWPKYLGGAFEQNLVEMSKSLHEAFHAGLDKVLSRWKGKAYYDNLSPEEKRQMLQDLADYVRAFDAEHGTQLYQAMVQNGFPGS